MLRNKFKTPVTYYGGKQRMASHIVAMLPPHKLYCEPFAGGLAVFFAKPKSEMEVINDTNSWAMKFYKACSSQFPLLRRLIVQTPQSRTEHRRADFILKNADHCDDIAVAWAFWVQTQMSFASKIGGGYGYAKGKNSMVTRTNNKKKDFTKLLKLRLDNVDMECNDALQVIKSRDSEHAFFYVDPPYYNSDCGHYKGYTIEDFKNLLDVLSTIKGKFLLSSYPSELLSNYTNKHGWHSQSIDSKGSVTPLADKIKTECLTANYAI